MKPRNQRQRLLERHIYPAVAAALPEFKRKRASFTLKLADVVQTVQVQTSVFAGASAATEFTINLYCLAVPLIGAFNWWSPTPATNTTHWNDRIGKFCRPPRDRWWSIEDDKSAAKAAKAVGRLMTPAARLLGRMRSTQQLIEYWVDTGDFGDAFNRERMLVAAMQWLDELRTPAATRLSLSVERKLRKMV